MSKTQSDDVQQLIGRAIELHRMNMLVEAEALYLQILNRRPRHFDAQHLLGVIRAQQGRLDEALTLVRSALKTKSNADVALSDCGLILHKLRRFDEALACFDKALAIRPGHPAALSNRGNVLAELGRFADALASYDRALALRADYPEALNNRAAALAALGRFDEALAGYDRAIAVRPQADAWRSRGTVLVSLGRGEDAVASFDRALAMNANDAQSHYFRGNALAVLRRYEDALAAFDRALALDPAHAAAHDNRGSALLQLRRTEDAIRSYDAALALDPGYVGALNNRGAALKQIRDHEGALADFDAALAIRPADADVLYNRANALKEMRRYGEALDAYRAARAVAPDHPDAFGIVETAASACAWPEVAEFMGDLERAIRSGKPTIAPFGLLFLRDDPGLHLQCAASYAADRFPSLPAPPAVPKAPGDRIRIAYLSADFHEHATAYLMAELLELHDRAAFEVLGVSFGRDDKSDMRRRVSEAFDRFEDVSGVSDREVARLIREAKVDIAIDLKGYTQESRPEILAYRPAPIQAAYLGYPGTMATGFIDYIIADPIVLPFDRQPFYTEKIVHLPDCYQVNDRCRRIADHAPTRAEAGLPDDGFVFCCFNNNHKITAPVFEAWTRLLQRVPGSVLWLLRGNEDAEARLRAAAKDRNIDPERLVFAMRAKLDDHLARHRLADLFLDTVPYNAHTTASDALWAGLPVLTCAGEAFAGRVAASLLNAVGLPELVTRSLGEYEDLALTLANDRPRLRMLRDRLGSSLQARPLFDTDRFRRHIETAYRTMWDIAQQGMPPRSFSV